MAMSTADKAKLEAMRERLDEEEEWYKQAGWGSVGKVAVICACWRYLPQVSLTTPDEGALAGATADGVWNWNGRSRLRPQT